MDCALYASPAVASGCRPPPGIGWTEAFADLPVARAMAALGLAVSIHTNGVAIQLEAARAGAGAAVLPCFLGDGDPALVRMTDALPLAAQDVWLVTNADLAGSERVRTVADWIVGAVAEAIRPDA